MKLKQSKPKIILHDYRAVLSYYASSWDHPGSDAGERILCKGDGDLDCRGTCIVLIT